MSLERVDPFIMCHKKKWVAVTRNPHKEVGDQKLLSECIENRFERKSIVVG
jgi:hypothetical protein